MNYKNLEQRLLNPSVKKYYARNIKSNCKDCKNIFIKTSCGNYLCLDCSKIRFIIRLRKQLQAVKIKVFSYYSKGKPKCNCCGITELGFLTIDHINNDGYKYKDKNRRGNNRYSWIIKENYPSGLQVLCYNCNCGRDKNGGICPHKR